MAKGFKSACNVHLARNVVAALGFPPQSVLVSSSCGVTYTTGAYLTYSGKGTSIDRLGEIATKGIAPGEGAGTAGRLVFNGSSVHIMLLKTTSLMLATYASTSGLVHHLAFGCNLPCDHKQ